MSRHEPEVTIRFVGSEVAKWVARRTRDPRTWDQPAEGIVIIAVHAPVFRDTGRHAESDLPYLGDAEVEVRLFPPAIDFERASDEIVAQALLSLTAADVPIACADRIAIDVKKA